MVVKVKLSALAQGHWYEYMVRFGLGGLTTVLAGLVAAEWGPVIGGLFPLAEAAALFSTKIGNTRSVNLTMPARTGSRHSQQTIGTRRTSGRPKVACTSARTTKLPSNCAAFAARAFARKSISSAR